MAGIMQLRISVADDEPDILRLFGQLLGALGHKVVSEAEDGVQLIKHARDLAPDLIIADLLMPRVSGLDAIREICRERPVAAIVVSGRDDLPEVVAAQADLSVEWLVKPAALPDFEAAIALASARFAAVEQLRREADDLREALEQRRVVETAKGILMRLGMSEPEAFGRLQRSAMNGGIKLVEAAREVIELEKRLRGEG
jgi:two-component system, response regulator PdtaR